MNKINLNIQNGVTDEYTKMVTVANDRIVVGGVTDKILIND